MNEKTNNTTTKDILTAKYQQKLILFLIIFPFFAIPLCTYFELRKDLVPLAILHFIIGAYVCLKNYKLVIAKALLLVYSIIIAIYIFFLILGGALLFKIDHLYDKLSHHDKYDMHGKVYECDENEDVDEDVDDDIDEDVDDDDFDEEFEHEKDK